MKPEKKENLLYNLQNKQTVLISACLLGEKCRYDGKDSLNKWIFKYTDIIKFIPFCPEKMGGLPTPRPAANIYGGDGKDVLKGKAKVINIYGFDVTKNFKRGAYMAIELANKHNIKIALVKDKSPSCGLKTPYCETTYDYGIGVTAALLNTYGIHLIEIGQNDILFYTGNTKELFICLKH